MSGQPKSHFLMYLEAMKEVGADTCRIHQLLTRWQVYTIDKVIATANLSQAEKAFLCLPFPL